MGGGNFDPSELFAGRAVFVHMPASSHSVHVHNGRPVHELERDIGQVGARIAWRGTGGHTFGAWPARQRDQADIRFAHGNRLGGVADVYDIRRATCFRRIHMTDILEPHIVDH